MRRQDAHYTCTAALRRWSDLCAAKALAALMRAGSMASLCLAGGPAQYAAVVFDDPALAGIGNASRVDASQLLALLPLLAAAAPAAQGGGGSGFGGLKSLGLGLAAGLAPVAWLASPEARVASGFLARMQTCAGPPRRGAARGWRTAVQHALLLSPGLLS